jgi:hypothetical protein
MRISDNDGDVHQSVDHQGGGALEAHRGTHDQLIRCLGLAGDVLQLVGHQGGGAHGAPLGPHDQDLESGLPSRSSRRFYFYNM